MSWEEKALVKLRNYFVHRSFTASEVTKLLTNYSQGTVYRLLNDLSREGKITKVEYGVFRAEPRRRETISSKGKRSLSPDLEKARNSLFDAGVDFMLTGYSVLGFFVHLLPRRAVHLVYVGLGSGESAVEALEDSGFKALLNPKGEREVNLALSLTKGDLFIIRERRELSGRTEDGLASVERGLVDLYFESTRRRIPFPEAEVGRIILDAIRTGDLDVSRLTKLASRRGVAGEIRAILKSESELPTKKGKGKTIFNKYVEAVLAGTMR
ncbi:MAG: hypothetical protein M1503_12385 [Thaumarchaeota archaeon]|nr:hypothetical protein [Nitrososphaerota archaeon]MCL5319038.1 hypothetical protein [Nitrososphaerota archaeon]